MMAFTIRKLLHPPSALPISMQGPIPAESRASVTMATIALLYCGIMFPIAAHVTPTMIAEGEWPGLLVLLAFVGVGIGLLAITVMSWLGRLLHGRVVLDLLHIARVGEPFAGAISFARGVGEGDRFLVKLECQLVRQVSLANRTSRGSGTVARFDTLWTEQVNRTAGAGGKLGFVFTPPPDLPGSMGADGDNSEIAWSVLVTQQSALCASSSFTVMVDGPPPHAVAMSQLLSAVTDPPKPTNKPWVVYGGTGVAIAIFAGVILFTLYQNVSPLFQLAAKLFN